MGQQQWRRQRARLMSLLVVLSAVLLPRADCISDDAGPLAALLGSLKAPAGALGTAETYQQVMRHKHTLSQGHLERSLAFMGSNLRLRRVLDRLLQPEQQSFHIGVIGGSISWGHGVQRGTQDWFSLLQQWVEATFPQHTFSFKNGCVPATQSSYVSSCLQQFVDAEADLVFVEYVTNDGYHHGSVDNSLVRSFERLLRKLLAFQRAPAVVLMQFLATDVQINKLPFYATGEDQYGVLAQYYSIPWLSYRDVVWHDYMAGRPGFKRYEIFPVQEERHPTPLGHRYMADMAIHLLQQTYLDSLLQPPDLVAVNKHPAAQVPSPMFTGNWESSNLICVVGEQLPHTVLENQGWQWLNEGSSIKPKWGFVSWQVGARLVLRVDTRASAGKPGEAHTAAKPTTAAAAGPAASTGQPPAAQAAAAAATRSAAAPAVSAEQPGGSGSDGYASPDMIVWVGYVKSWRDMGTASFNCVKGCKCQGTTIDALHDLGNTQQHMVKLYTTQAAECLVEVKVNPWSRTKQHRFKVTAIMVTHAVEYSGHGDFTDMVLLDNIPSQPAEAADVKQG